MISGHPLIQHAKELFTSQFGGAADIAGIAPGRVNLIGGHVDYNDGIVLPLAVERYTVVAAVRNRLPFARIYSQSTDERLQVNVDKSICRMQESWQNYVLGVLAGFQERGSQLPGFDAVICSNVDSGAGLSSSAALEVSLARVVAHWCEPDIDETDLAELCQQAEHRFAGVPCGIMDQYASVFGRAGCLMALDCQNRELEYLQWPSKQASIIVFNSNTPHQLMDSEYSNRKQQCASVLNKLKIASFRETNSEHLTSCKAELQPVELQRARHVVSEFERCQVAIQAIRRGDLETFGKQLYGSHESLRDDYEVSCRELDCLVDAGSKLGIPGGVWGMRMTGGGFGGSVVALVATESIAAIAQSICPDYFRECGRKATWFSTQPAGGAKLVVDAIS